VTPCSVTAAWIARTIPPSLARQFPPLFHTTAANYKPLVISQWNPSFFPIALHIIPLPLSRCYIMAHVLPAYLLVLPLGIRLEPPASFCMKLGVAMLADSLQCLEESRQPGP